MKYGIKVIKKELPNQSARMQEYVKTDRGFEIWYARKNYAYSNLNVAFRTRASLAESFRDTEYVVEAIEE